MPEILDLFRGIVAGRRHDLPPLPLALADTAEPAAVEGSFARGHVVLRGLVDGRACAELERAVDRMLEAGMPAVAVYADASLFALGRRVARAVSAALGQAYALVDDFWAWKIPRGQSGWAPHRGTADLLDRDAPEIVNTWIALSDAEADRSCMWLVPLDEDPGYPADLARADTRAGRPVPLAAGDALAWNANVLHWGGACAPHARGPRVSCSFSVVRRDALAARGLPALENPDLRGRVEAVARQIATYGAGQPDVSPAVLEWARATAALWSLSAHLPRAPVGKEG